MNQLQLFLLASLAIQMLHGISSAFDPPVDQQGPLTVRIDGPAEISNTEPFSISLQLQNSGKQALDGTVRVAGIDGWQCIPNDAVSFSVPAEANAKLNFQVAPSQSTYAAIYPLHAWAEFKTDGTRTTAHPILIVRADVPPPKAPTPTLPWEPLKLAKNRSLALWQMPTHRSTIAVFGREPVTKPIGWTGSANSNRTSVSFRHDVQLPNGTHDAIAIHPPWADGQVGTAWVEFPLALPNVSRVTLLFVHAVTPTGDGDGVTFRVRAVDIDAPPGKAGEVAFERHSATKEWVPGVANLTRWAGRTIRLQLESHPGPDKNTEFDQSYWGEPKLVVGSPPRPGEFPPTTAGQPANRISLTCGGYQANVQLGTRGLLDADIGFIRSDQKRLWIRGFEVQVAGSQLEDPSAPVTLTSTTRESLKNGVRVRHHFSTAHGELDLVGTAIVQNSAFRVRWKLENAPPDRPWQTIRIESISPGPISEDIDRVYAGHGNVIEKPQAFRLNFDGHRLSTSFVGFDFSNGVSLLQAVDLPPTALHVDPERNRSALESSGNATFTFIPGTDVWDLCRAYRDINGLRASAGIPRLAGRFVFDLWGGRYGQTTDSLRQAFRYGLTDSAVVWHNWQRWGYDYRLPEIYPPHKQGGTEAELKSMITTCRQHDVLISLHDNYIDYYPDADGFSYTDVVAFNDQGRPIKAWLNEGRQAQSYLYRADQITKFLQPNIQQIHRNLAPSAYFIDVWSSRNPYGYWTSDGRYFDNVSTRDTWGKHFAWIRGVLGDQAPQISESGHDQLIGWLDGAQTNHLRVGKPHGEGRYSWSVWDIDCGDAERTPWFDAVHHDRFVLHGAGYSSRFQAGLDPRMHGIYSDDYVTTEVLTGHPAMVSDPFGHDVVRKYWLTHDLMRALAMRTIEGVEFAGDDLHRQHIRWSGDGQIWVNRGDSPWPVGNLSLPQFGFLAQIPTAQGKLVAAIHERNGLIVEQAQSADSLYVNARGSLGQLKRIHPEVSIFRQTAPGTFALETTWDAAEPIPGGYRPFLHFVNDEDEIAFQASSGALPWNNAATGQFTLKATATIPPSARSGDEYELRVGLYNPTAGGNRLLLLGDDDGERRIRLGTLRLATEENDTPQINWTARQSLPDPYLQRNNLSAKPIDFGWLVTAGGCRLTREEDGVLLTPLPDEFGNATWEVRWNRLPWNLPHPTRVEALSESGEMLWNRAIDGEITIDHDVAAFAYRFAN